MTEKAVQQETSEKKKDLKNYIYIALTALLLSACSINENLQPPGSNPPVEIPQDISQFTNQVVSQKVNAFQWSGWIIPPDKVDLVTKALDQGYFKFDPSELNANTGVYEILIPACPVYADLGQWWAFWVQPKITGPGGIVVVKGGIAFLPKNGELPNCLKPFT